MVSALEIEGKLVDPRETCPYVGSTWLAHIGKPSQCCTHESLQELCSLGLGELSPKAETLRKGLHTQSYMGSQTNSKL